MLENCRWLLYISRLFGCHPHTIDEKSVLTNFHLLTIYSLVMCIMYCVAAFYTFDIKKLAAFESVNVRYVLLKINQYSRTLYMILSTLLSFLYHTEFESTVAIAHKFDDLMQYYRSYTNNKRKNHYVQWLIILLIFSIWVLFITFLIINFKNSSTTTNSLFLILRLIPRLTFTIEIAKFCFLYDALRRRFHHLNGLYHGLIGIDKIEIDTDIFKVSKDHNLTLIKLQQSHRYLREATNHLTSYYNPQLLCWITCLLIDIITLIFANLFGNISYSNVMQESSINYVTLLILSFQVIAISRICHLTCNQANALAGIIFSVKASTLKPNEFSTHEMIELGIFLRAHPLCIKVYGLFNLNSRFIFSVYSIILMYIALIWTIP